MGGEAGGSGEFENVSDGFEVKSLYGMAQIVQLATSFEKVMSATPRS